MSHLSLGQTGLPCGAMSVGAAAEIPAVCPEPRPVACCPYLWAVLRCPALRCPALPCRAVPCRAVPCRALPGPASRGDG